ncbi:MAG: hypothetical protein Q7T93_12365, partial [Methylobacterium sp.]|uniref:peptidoglycan-binding domain-containing protein n=1 Tax=Methylobacterium sp. TaxID=409 RepID=UPI0027226E73
LLIIMCLSLSPKVFVYGDSLEDLQAQIAQLMAQIKALQSGSSSSTSSGASYSFSRNLTLGSTGDDVKALQTFLIDKGHYCNRPFKRIFF